MFESSGKITDSEEIRIRSLVASRTGRSELVENVHPFFAYAGLYPTIMRPMDKNGKYIGVEEFQSEEFFNKIKKWPDVYAAVENHVRTRGLGYQEEENTKKFIKKLDDEQINKQGTGGSSDKA